MASLRPAVVGHRAPARMALEANFCDRIVVLRDKSNSLSQTLLEAAARHTGELRAEAGTATWTLMAILVFGIGASLGVGLALTRASVLQPLARLDGAMRRRRSAPSAIASAGSTR